MLAGETLSFTYIADRNVCGLQLASKSGRNKQCIEFVIKEEIPHGEKTCIKT